MRQQIIVKMFDSKPFEEIKFEIALADLQLKVKGDNPYQSILRYMKYGPEIKERDIRIYGKLAPKRTTSIATVISGIMSNVMSEQEYAIDTTP